MAFKWSVFKRVVQLVLPPVLVGVGVPANIAEKVAGFVAEAEDLKNAKGAEKKRHVMNLTKDFLDVAKVPAQDTGRVLNAVDKGIEAGIAVTKVVQREHKDEGK